MLKDFYYPSCGAGKIRARCWEPDGEPIGVIQLVHGIAEHIERYDDFAAYLNHLGFLVIAQDHMGHGKSIDDAAVRGYFTGGWFAAVEDTYQLLHSTMKKYPHIPYVVFGHSMGSFLTRTLLAKHPDCGIAGAVICGTGWMPEIVLTVGRLIASLVCRIRGERRASNLLQKLMFGSYNNRIAHPRTPFDWLTTVNDVVDAYIEDPLCGFVASAGLVRDMLSGMMYIQKRDTLKRMNRTMPVFFIAGAEDPVGNYGDGVLRAAKEFRNVGMQNVSEKIYSNDRHEILNEYNREEVYQDVVQWIKML